MHLYVNFGLTKPLPPRLHPALARRIHVVGNRASVKEAEAVPWQRVFEHLREQQFTFDTDPTLFAGVTHHTWESAQDAVAAVLGPAEEYRASNPRSDYSPVLPDPHLGYLPGERPLMVPETPRGHLARVGEDLIASDRLLRYLGTSTNALGPVVHAGRTISRWNRLFIDETSSIMSPMSVKETISCAVCGARLRPALGVWIADASGELHHDVAHDVLGYDHLELQHPILVSVDRARFLSRELKGGVSIAPVFAHDSEVANVITEVLCGIRSLTTSV